MFKKTPLFIIDGIPVNVPIFHEEIPSDSYLSTELSVIENLFCSSIRKVELVENSSLNSISSIIPAIEWVIFIYLENKTAPTINQGVVKYSIEGYQNLESSPYLQKNIGELYWNSEVSTDVFGQATVSIPYQDVEVINTLIKGATGEGQGFRTETAIKTSK